MEFSKRLISDIRALLWVVTVGGLLLAAYYCVQADYAGALLWLSAMVGLPWAAHGTVCAFYLNMAKSDHKERAGLLTKPLNLPGSSRTAATAPAYNNENNTNGREEDNHYGTRLGGY